MDMWAQILEVRAILLLQAVFPDTFTQLSKSYVAYMNYTSWQWVVYTIFVTVAKNGPTKSLSSSLWSQTLPSSCYNNTVTWGKELQNSFRTAKQAKLTWNCCGFKWRQDYLDVATCGRM